MHARGRVGSTCEAGLGQQRLNSSPALSQDEQAEAKPTASYQTRRCCSVLSPSFFHHPLFFSSAPALQNVKSVSPVRGGGRKKSNEKHFWQHIQGCVRSSCPVSLSAGAETKFAAFFRLPGAPLRAALVATGLRCFLATSEELAKPSDI